MQHKVGTRLSSSFGYICGFCSKPVKTIEKVERGGWRCLICVGITEPDWITRNRCVPTAAMLLRQHTQVPIKYKEEPMENGCLCCRAKYKVTEVDHEGFPLHVRYCNDCTQYCPTCKKWKVITQFLPDIMSNGYREWIASSGSGHSPLGQLIGRENYLNECMACKPYRSTQEEEKPPIAKDDVLARLEAILKSSSQ